MSNPKRSHYISKFYLENFTQDDVFHVYDRKQNKYSVQTPLNTACIKYYYKLEGQYNFDSNMVEKIFSDIECRTKPVIEKIKNKKSLNVRDRYNLSLFISFLKTRVPATEKLINEMIDKFAKKNLKLYFSSDDFTQKRIKDYERKTGNKVNIPELKKFLDKTDNYIISVGKDFNLGARLVSALKISESLFCMDWVFLYAHHKSSFILSDNPLIIIPPKDHNYIYGLGIMTKNAVKIIPITSSICLMILEYNPDDALTLYKNNFPREEIRKINVSLAINSDRYIIGKDRELLEKIVKITKINEWQIGNRVKINSPVN